MRMHTPTVWFAVDLHAAVYENQQQNRTLEFQLRKSRNQRSNEKQVELATRGRA